jgi:dihydroorotase
VNTIALIRPDDWHVHLRDGAEMRSVMPDTAKRFARAIVMPNLRPAVTTTEQAAAYRDRIRAALPARTKFEPLMTLYLTDNTKVGEIARAKKSGIVYGVKYYPAGATTNSDSGVTDIAKCLAAIEAMQEAGLPLLVHGEVTDPETDVFDRERVFIERVLAPLVARFPQLKVVLEHVTTREAVEFVKAAGCNVAATITAHHLLINRNALFAGGLNPHHYCLPAPKRESHRQALIAAAVSGNPKFFLGTDSAPHSRHAKESPCGCAGIYTGHAALELYVEVFEQAGALNKLEAFASFFGADFYGLPRNRETITLIKESWQVPEEIPFGDEKLVPFRAGKTLGWSIREAVGEAVEDLS